jgi:hypothetical protein
MLLSLLTSTVRASLNSMEKQFWESKPLKVIYLHGSSSKEANGAFFSPLGNI